MASILQLEGYRVYPSDQAEVESKPFNEPYRQQNKKSNRSSRQQTVECQTEVAPPIPPMAPQMPQLAPAMAQYQVQPPPVQMIVPQPYPVLPTVTYSAIDKNAYNQPTEAIIQQTTNDMKT